MGRGLQAAPGLVCFDLDGTLYHDDRIYLRMIDYYFAGTPWEKEIGSVKAEMSRVLAGGNPAFRCGRFAPKEWGVVSLIQISEPTRLGKISDGVLCLEKKKKRIEEK